MSKILHKNRVNIIHEVYLALLNCTYSVDMIQYAITKYTLILVFKETQTLTERGQKNTQ